MSELEGAADQFTTAAAIYQKEGLGQIIPAESAVSEAVLNPNLTLQTALGAAGGYSVYHGAKFFRQTWAAKEAVRTAQEIAKDSKIYKETIKLQMVTLGAVENRRKLDELFHLARDSRGKRLSQKTIDKLINDAAAGRLKFSFSDVKKSGVQLIHGAQENGGYTFPKSAYGRAKDLATPYIKGAQFLTLEEIIGTPNDWRAAKARNLRLLSNPKLNENGILNSTIKEVRQHDEWENILARRKEILETSRKGVGRTAAKVVLGGSIFSAAFIAKDIWDEISKPLNANEHPGWQSDRYFKPSIKLLLAPDDQARCNAINSNLKRITEIREDIMRLKNAADALTAGRSAYILEKLRMMGGAPHTATNDPAAISLTERLHRVPASETSGPYIKKKPENDPAQLVH